ncbi:hypothetical protein S245_039058, partial [Arachis hypogaea]
ALQPFAPPNPPENLRSSSKSKTSHSTRLSLILILSFPSLFTLRIRSFALHSK